MLSQVQAALSFDAFQRPHLQMFFRDMTAFYGMLEDVMASANSVQKPSIGLEGVDYFTA